MRDLRGGHVSFRIPKAYWRQKETTWAAASRENIDTDTVDKPGVDCSCHVIILKR